MLSHGTDSGGAYVRAGVDLPGSSAAIVGDDNLIVVIRRSSASAPVTFVLDAQTAVGKLAARGANSTLQTVTLALRSSIVYGGKSHGITFNPTSQTAMTNSVTARACASPACTTLRTTTTSAGATVHLPKTVTLAAPVTATYGYRYSIGGTGRSGDTVSLQSLGTSGLVPPRGTTMVQARRHVRHPRHDAIALHRRWRPRHAGTRALRRRRRSKAATPRSTASPDRTRRSPSPSRTSCCSARRAESSCTSPSASREPTTTCAWPSNSDPRRSVTGYATHSGTFSKTILKPAERGNLRVVASVPGADTAISNATPLSR